ncbi:MAG: AAA family ATPase [Sphingomicrobium sp.]
MSMHSPDRVNAQWKADTGPAPVRLLLAGVEGEASALVGAKAAGFPLELVIADPTQTVDPSVLEGAAAAVVQVNCDDPSSVARFEELAKGPVPLIAAAYEPPLAFVRKLVRAGAHDVVPLPLDPEELETALDPIRRMASAQGQRARAGHQKIVTMIKSEGGVGATALLGQLATRFAAAEAAAGREACLLDLDVQFGDAAFQLGIQPKLSFSDLVAAGKRMDSDLLRSVAGVHSSGLNVVAAPREIMPLESVTSDQVMAIVDLATAEYGTLFVDLPMNWTNWSLSLLARSDIVLMVTELRVPSLHRARRQLDLMDSQDLHTLDVRIVLNRTEKGLFKTIDTNDAERVLRRPVAFTISNDHETMNQAIDRGIPISEVRRKCALAKDIDAMDKGVAAALGLEH